MPAPFISRDAAAVRLYLAALAGEAPEEQFLELRYRVGPDAMRSQFFAVGDREPLIREMADLCATTDVYVGCAPRWRHAGGRHAVDRVWTLWAECDGAAAAHSAVSFRPGPAVVVGSGSGENIHAYWPLSEPLRPRDAEEANYRLARALGADPVCFDAARILRPPATLNHKHDPPARVALHRIVPGLRFAPGDVVGRLPAIEDRRIADRWEERAPRTVPRDPLLRIPPRVYIADLLEVRVANNHKVRCPFHHDERPSLHAYPTGERGWACFSCGRGGTIYDLAAGLWGLGTRGRDFIRLRSRLVERYGHELTRNGPERTL